MAKKIDMQAAMDAFFAMDEWTQRKIGRQAGLTMYNELARDMPKYAGEFKAAKMWEKQAIRSCDLKDEAMWLEANAEIKRLMDSIKLEAAE
jgi:hypothetical protein